MLTALSELKGLIGASRMSSPRPPHVSDSLQNGSATPSKCSSSETALQMVLGTWLLHLDNASCASLSGQAQHPYSSPPACGRSPTEIVGSNPTGGMDICLLCVVCCQVEVSATSWSLVQRSPTDLHTQNEDWGFLLSATFPTGGGHYLATLYIDVFSRCYVQWAGQ
jgi:hypothetical protein